jgi:integrase
MKELTKTKVTVRLRKVEDRKEWYVYLESYPVFIPGKKQPQRVREYFNRTVTSVEWDKKRTARTTEESKTYKPKRDDNGIILCRSEKDRETMSYADSVRKLRQHECDTVDLYTDADIAKAEEKERAQQNFVDYFDDVIKKRHARNSDSIHKNWKRTLELLKQFIGETLPFSKIDIRFAEDFRLFLLSAPCGGKKRGSITQNTASTYFAIFKSALKQAFVDGYFSIDLSAKIKGMTKLQTRREFLTTEELNQLAATPCDNDLMKRASLFSALTGLRHCDIQKMQWKELQIDGKQIRLNFTQQKTKGVEYMPISKQAFQLCGAPAKPNDFVFPNFPNLTLLAYHLKKWLQAAGINRNITFHCFRHTFATLQLGGGTDIYTVSKLLGHTDIKTTQIYAKVIDEKKLKAAETIKLNLITE